jgi:UDP-N-acetylglucosamine 2-epimerase (non-hydrolysing)
MIDSLCHLLGKARESGFRRSLGVKNEESVVVTLHRPSNVDDPERLAAIASALRAIAEERPVLFTVHPRTAERLKAAAISLGGVRVMPPIRYHEMLDLVDGASVVITDSGGLQEETTALGVPCLTVRRNTERPITVVEGTNRLVPDPNDLLEAVRSSKRDAVAKRPEGWDGHAGERIVRALTEYRAAADSRPAATAAHLD